MQIPNLRSSYEKVGEIVIICRITHHRDGRFGGEVHFALDLTSV